MMGRIFDVSVKEGSEREDVMVEKIFSEMSSYLICNLCDPPSPFKKEMMDSHFEEVHGRKVVRLPGDETVYFVDIAEAKKIGVDVEQYARTLARLTQADGACLLDS